ncbi:hypothetical protein TNCV_3783691 [Trichonephila clavipes]|nr:hypothetical protein TNCV_3783691 [Trichonephila clavipes]
MQMIRVSSTDTHHARLWRHLKALFKAWRFRRFQVQQLCFSCGFFKKRSVMSRGKQRSAFDQVSQFDKQQSGLSARCPLLGLPLTQNHRRLRRQWCDEKKDVGGRME